MNCWCCYKPVGRLPLQMRLGCLELRPGAVGFPRTPTSEPISFGTCAHQGANESLSPDVFRRLSVAAFAVFYVFIALTLVIANCMLRSLSTPKSPSAVFCSLPALLQSQILRGLLGEGVTLCGHTCFNTTCSLESVLKDGADC